MRRWVAKGLVVAILAALTPGVALAGSGGRKNTALGLSAGALYTWFNGGFKHAGKRNTALALTAASVVAWHKYKKAKHAERQRAQLARAYYSRGYGYGRPVYYTRGYRATYSAPYRSGRVAS